MSETWNADIPAVGNVVTTDVSDMEENFDYLMHRFGYRVDSSEADQGIAGGGNTVKDLVDAIGGTKTAVLFFPHHMKDGNTTTYTFSNSEVITSNITLLIQPGAILSDGGGSADLTIYSPENIIARPKQRIFNWSGSGAVSFSKEGHSYITWFNDSPTVTSIQQAIDAMEGGSSDLLELPGGDTISIGSTITISKNGFYKFNHRELSYTSDTGTAVDITDAAKGAKIDDLYLKKSSQAFGSSNVGVALDSLKGGRLRAIAANFTTGIHMDSSSDGIAYSDFYLQYTNCLVGLKMEVSGSGYMNGNAFWNNRGGSVGAAEDAGNTPYAVYLDDSGSPSMIKRNSFYSPVLEGNTDGYAMYVRSQGRGNTIIDPYFEGNQGGLSHITLHSDTTQIAVIGGFCTSPSATIDESEIGASDLTNILILDPFRDESYLWWEGIFRAEKQGFQNLAKNGHFQWWTAGGNPVDWSGGIQESTTVKFGDYSLKMDRSGGDSSLHRDQTLDSDLVDYLKGQKVSLGAWVYSDTAEAGGVSIYTDAGNSTMPDNRSTVNEWVFVKRVGFEIPAGATTIKIQCENTGDAITYHDGVILTVGENSPNFYPKSLTDYDYLTGSVTYDPTNLADGAGETKSLTVTGAELGDFVLVSAPYDLEDVIATAYVQAADTVEIRLQNETGGAINLASGTWKVMVFKQ